MNTELIQKVYDLVINEPSALDMSQWGYRSGQQCGTTACVAGHAALLAGTAKYNVRGSLSPVDLGADWYEVGAEALGISIDLASWLFDDSTTEEEATNALRILLETGDEEQADAYLRYFATHIPARIHDEEEYY